MFRIMFLLFLFVFSQLFWACGAIESATNAVEEAKEEVEETQKDIKEKLEFAKAEVKGNISEIKDAAGGNLEDFKVVAQNLVDSSVQYIEVDNLGNFSFDMDSSSFALTVLDANSEIAGMLMSSQSSGLAAADSIMDLGSLKVAGEKLLGLAQGLDSTIRIDSQYIASNLSLGNFGLGEGGNNGPTFDRDLDGVIDLFDVDIDNNGILNDQDIEDGLLSLSQLGAAADLVNSVSLNTSLVTEYKMPENQRMKQAGISLKVFPLMGVNADSITITGPDYLFASSSEWRYMCNTCQGDNRPLIEFNGQLRKGKMILAEDGGMPQWQALIGDQSENQSMALMRPGDVVVFNVYKNNMFFPIIRTVSWVFRQTPTLEQIQLKDGTVLYDKSQIESFSTKPMEQNPEVDSTADLQFIVNMMRGRSENDNLPLIGFDNYEIQFMQESASNGGPGQQYGMPNITSHENAQYLEKIEDKHQLKVTIPMEYLKNGVPAGRPSKPNGFVISGYKIDLGMYDRSGNKTVMQIRLNLKP